MKMHTFWAHGYKALPYSLLMTHNLSSLEREIENTLLGGIEINIKKTSPSYRSIMKVIGSREISNAWKRQIESFHF